MGEAGWAVYSAVMRNRFARKLVALFAAVGLLAILSTSWGAGASAHDQKREAAASKAYAGFAARHKTGIVTTETVYTWSARWYDAQRKTMSALPAAQAHLARIQSLAAQVKSNVAAGLATSADDDAAAYYLAEAEGWVADAGGPR